MRLVGSLTLDALASTARSRELHNDREPLHRHVLGMWNSYAVVPEWLAILGHSQGHWGLSQ
jgi:hypothetical protein